MERKDTPSLPAKPHTAVIANQSADWCVHRLGMPWKLKFAMTGKRWLAVLLLYVVLGNWKGYLALFDGGEDEPRQIYPRQVASLPPDDQLALEEGILIRNERRLKQLLKEYLS